MIAFAKLLQEKEIPRPFCSQDACLAVVSPRELGVISQAARRQNPFVGNGTITNTDGLKPSENPTHINLNNWFTRCYFSMCENRQVFFFVRTLTSTRNVLGTINLLKQDSQSCNPPHEVPFKDYKLRTCNCLVIKNSDILLIWDQMQVLAVSTCNVFQNQINSLWGVTLNGPKNWNKTWPYIYLFGKIYGISLSQFTYSTPWFLCQHMPLFLARTLFWQIIVRDFRFRKNVTEICRKISFCEPGFGQDLRVLGKGRHFQPLLLNCSSNIFNHG